MCRLRDYGNPVFGCFSEDVHFGLKSLGLQCFRLMLAFAKSVLIIDAVDCFYLVCHSCYFVLGGCSGLFALRRNFGDVETFGLRTT